MRPKITYCGFTKINNRNIDNGVCVTQLEEKLMQLLTQHITKLAKLAAAVTSTKSWALNYGGQIMSVLGGEDRFEPTMEGYRD